MQTDSNKPDQQNEFTSTNNGFAPILLLLVVIFVALAGFIYIRQQKLNTQNAQIKQGVSVDDSKFYNDDEDDLEEDL